MKRIPEFVEFCKKTDRDSSYVVPPTIKITTSCGLRKEANAAEGQQVINKSFKVILSFILKKEMKAE